MKSRDSILARIEELKTTKPDGWRKELARLVRSLDRMDTHYLPPDDLAHSTALGGAECVGRKAMTHLWSARDMAREQRLLPRSDGRVDE